MHVCLFIAEDGEFVYPQLDTAGQMLVVRPVVRDINVLAECLDDMVTVDMKVYRLHWIAFDHREWEGVPFLERDAYLRRVIRELEAKRDAPWKVTSDTGV